MGLRGTDRADLRPDEISQIIKNQIKQYEKKIEETETGTVIVGAGKLGRALLDYDGFEESGLNVMAGFDLEPWAEYSERGKPIYPMNRLEHFCKHYDVHIGVITVPAENAQQVCDTLVACGITAIWNFAPVHLKVPDYVIVKSENLAVSLTTLRAQMKNQKSVC